jgi:hypothetical protein
VLHHHRRRVLRSVRVSGEHPLAEPMREDLRQRRCGLRSGGGSGLVFVADVLRCWRPDLARPVTWMMKSESGYYDKSKLVFEAFIPDGFQILGFQS